MAKKKKRSGKLVEAASEEDELTAEESERDEANQADNDERDEFNVCGVRHKVGRDARGGRRSREAANCSASTISSQR